MSANTSLFSDKQSARQQEEIRKCTNVLAKLMAKENITIVDGGVSTSMIDLDNRIIYVVTFKPSSPLNCKEVRVTSLAHEVGHALFTPASLMHEAIKDKMPNLSQYVNLVEDIRIEKLIKNQYKGLHKTMQAGRKIMLDNNFYGLSAKLTPNEMEFCNKLIVYTKVGKENSGITLSSKEECVLRFIERHAIDEPSVIQCAKFLYLFCQQQKDKDESERSSEKDDELDSNSSNEQKDNTASDEDSEEIDYDSQYDENDELDSNSSNEQKDNTASDEDSEEIDYDSQYDENDESNTNGDGEDAIENNDIIDSLNELFKKAASLNESNVSKFNSVDELNAKLIKNDIENEGVSPITITRNNVSKHIKKIIPKMKLKKFNIS